MKPLISLLAGLLLSTAARADTPLQTTWHQVMDNSSYLDNLIAKKQLDKVHEAAYNLRDSVRDLRATPPAASAGLPSLVTQIGAMAEDLDRSGDKNDLRGTVAIQRKLHLALDAISALYGPGTLQAVGPVTAQGPVKDPVCRMTVDPANAPGKVVYAGQTYYFCSLLDAGAFKSNPAKYAALAEEINFGRPKSFAISLATQGNLAPGKSVKLTFAVREAGNRAVVKNFQRVHEKLMHLIIVSRDLGYFGHVHPELGPDGRFRLSWPVPAAGSYSLFADFTPADGLNQILRSQLQIPGKAPAGTRPLVADTVLVKSMDGFEVSLRLNSPLRVRHESLLTYTIHRNGAPVKDMQAYLGAMGHLMAINQNGVDAVHTHVVGAGGAVSAAMATASGPNFTYELTPPAPGLTKIWAQFQHGGRVLTVPFVFRVLPAPPQP